MIFYSFFFSIIPKAVIIFFRIFNFFSFAMKNQIEANSISNEFVLLLFKFTTKFYTRLDEIKLQSIIETSEKQQ